MNYIHRCFGFISFVCLLCGSAAGGEDAAETEGVISPMDTRAVLIRDAAIRRDLGLSEQQARAVQQLCDDLDGPLFALRDVPADTTDPEALKLVAQVNQLMEKLPGILNMKPGN